MGLKGKLKNHKKLFFWILLCVVFAVPFLIHIAFFLNAPFDFMTAQWEAGNVLEFYGALVGATGTIALGYVAYWQTKKAHEQTDKANKIASDVLQEMILQREQAERPYVVIGFECSFENNSLYFTLTNHGNRPAENVSVQFDEKFLNAVGDQKRNGNQSDSDCRYKDKLLLLLKPFNISLNQSYKVYFGSIGSDIMRYEENITITCSYGWRKINGETVTDKNEVTLNISNYHWISEKWLNKNNQPIDKIAKLLAKIEKNISKIANESSVQDNRNG